MKKISRRRWLQAILLALLVGGLIYHASLPVPTGPAEGLAIEGQIDRPPSKPGTIRIGTFNVHAGKGRDGHRDLQRVADCIASANLDFVALGEVRGHRFSPNQDQAAQLGRRLEMGWLFAPAGRVWYYRDSGNGLLSSLPVSFWQRIPLSSQHDHSPRNAVLVGLPRPEGCPGRTIHVLLTHITRGDDRDRQSQLRAVIAMFLALGEPSDLNSDADDPQVRRLLEAPGVGDPVGETLGPKTPRRIDWILTRGLRCLDAGIRDDGASDHPLIWAELELLPEGS